MRSPSPDTPEHTAMDTLFRTLLALHVAAGFTALLTGLVAIVSRKGGPLHARTGRLFHGAMVAVALTAVALSALKGGRFLLHIGLFALYQVHAGLRSIRNKGLRPAAQDWAGLALGGGNGVLMIATGNVVLLVFGGISTALAITDLRLFLRALRGRPLPELAWLRRHIGMMLGTYIATTTAFLLTLMRDLDVGWPHFLLPTIVGVPFIAYATWRFTRKGPARADQYHYRVGLGGHEALEHIAGAGVEPDGVGTGGVVPDP